jgi:antitoxin HicB
MYMYPAHYTREENGITVTFPDIPEAVTCGYSEQEATEFAADALVSALSVYMDRKADLPKPSKPRGKNVRIVELSALQQAKLWLYSEMRSAGVRKAELARRLNWHKSQVDRLLDLKHASRFDQIEQAFRAIDKRLSVRVESVSHPQQAHI